MPCWRYKGRNAEWHEEEHRRESSLERLSDLRLEGKVTKNLRLNASSIALGLPLNVEENEERY